MTVSVNGQVGGGGKGGASKKQPENAIKLREKPTKTNSNNAKEKRIFYCHA